MSAISNVLSKLAHLDIFGEVFESEIDIKGWIANQSYLIENISTANSFSLKVGDEKSLKSALANDCNRMSMAAFETICGIRKEPHFPKSGSWAAIRTYYAAFFTAHAFLRLFGISCSQLEKEHVGKIYEMAYALNMHNGIQRFEEGFYVIQISKDFQTVSFEKVQDSHRDTWAEFLTLVNKLINDINSATALAKHKIEAQDLLIRIKNGITRAGCSNKGNWLSHMRNNINYRHSHGVWYPFGRRGIKNHLLPSIEKKWKSDPAQLDLPNKKEELEIFFELSLLILAAFRDLLVTCANRADSPNPIFQNGALKMLKVLKAT